MPKRHVHPAKYITCCWLGELIADRNIHDTLQGSLGGMATQKAMFLVSRQTSAKIIKRELMAQN
jgi:hypothetical protein